MQKTTNYQLPKWEKTDRILMDDFNGMTAALDTALQSAINGKAASSHTHTQSAIMGLTAALAAKGNCRIQAGSYTGTGTWGEDGKTPSPAPAFRCCCACLPQQARAYCSPQEMLPEGSCSAAAATTP